MIKKVTIKRFHADNDGVVGVLEVDGHTFYTLELPWMHNSRGISCIPEGFYSLKPHGWEQDSKVKFEMVWEAEEVPNRSHILIHAGNYKKDTDGCILVGKGISVKDGAKMVTNSRTAINQLRKIIGNDPAILNIEKV